jgi:hypothetical protein
VSWLPLALPLYVARGPVSGSCGGESDVLVPTYRLQSPRL